MGNLTTITIWNDWLYDLVKKPKELTKLIEAHVSGGAQTIEKEGVKLFKPRHSSDHTIYVHMGNDVQEINCYSPETRALLRDHPKFFHQIMNYMEFQLKKLRELQEGYPSHH